MDVDFRLLANRGLRNLSPYQPGKQPEEIVRELRIPPPLKLASNENPLGASPKALLAVKKILPQAHIYPDGSCYLLKQTLAQFLALHPEQITVGNGSENILELIVKSYLKQDDNAIISAYTFLVIPILLQMYNVKSTIIPTKEWKSDIPIMLQSINSKTRVLFLVNPNNPAGTYTTEKEFLLLMESLPAHILVVVDEAYVEYVSNADYPNTLKYLSAYPNLVIVRTFSKAYGLAGFRLGYALSSPAIADILNRARLPFNVNALAAAAAQGAILDQAHVAKSIKVNNEGMRQLTAGLQKMGLTYIPSIGNFITIDMRKPNVYQKLLTKGIIVRSLEAYQMPNFIRVTISTSAHNEQFLAALNAI